MKTMGRIITIAICVTLMLYANAFCAELKIGAGAAATENILKPIKDHFEKATGIKLQIISSGPKIALEDLQKGAIHAAAGGLTFEEWLNLMKKEGAEVKDPSKLHQVVIGKDKIIVLLHKDNPVNALSKEQLKLIFTGKAQNWKEVGGKDSPIIVVWGKLTPGTNTLFIKNILDGQPVTKDVLEATTAEDIKHNVASNPEAIGIGPIAILDGSVKSPSTPEVSRQILLLTVGKPSTEVQKLIDYINGEGKKYIK
ncbi:MAG: substrate-binding domain-containing protein [Thermodesulfovibrionales bacterium]|nr:substrate-binding domain-containing protein [Thermodesulfovibrionales bacterium]